MSSESLALHQMEGDPPAQFLIATCDHCKQEFVRRFASYEQRSPDHPKFYSRYSCVCGACDRVRAGKKHLRMAEIAFAAAKTSRASQVRGLAKAKANNMKVWTSTEPHPVQLAEEGDS